jgi:glycosyltransferase involved in cell wall biosynthesis
MDELRKEGFTVLRFEANVGLPEARNRGISLARGRYVCCLDADDTIEPTYFEKCVSLLESNPGLSFVYPHLKTFGDEHQLSLAEPFNLRLLMEYNHIVTTAIFRKNAWEAVGGYDPQMTGLEDWELWIKLGKAGFRGKLLPEILFNYRKHGLTLFHRTQQKHRELLTRIRSNHADLYSHPELAEEIANTYRDYRVANPFLNLSSKNQYLSPPRRVGLVIAATLSPQNTHETSFYRLLNEIDDFHFLAVTTKIPYAQVLTVSDETDSWPAQVYSLPAFLDIYCWLDFVLNLIRTRSAQFVIIMNSELGYEWSKEIKEQTSVPVLDIVTTLGEGRVDLVKKFDRFIDHYISPSENVTASLVHSIGIPEAKVHPYRSNSSEDDGSDFITILEKALAETS